MVVAVGRDRAVFMDVLRRLSGRNAGTKHLCHYVKFTSDEKQQLRVGIRERPEIGCVQVNEIGGRNEVTLDGQEIVPAL